jgi:hypothetical protein
MRRASDPAREDLSPGQTANLACDRWYVVQAAWSLTNPGCVRENSRAMRRRGSWTARMSVAAAMRCASHEVTGTVDRRTGDDRLVHPQGQSPALRYLSRQC